MIDCESRCVWSQHTLRCHVRQDLTDATARPTLHVNTDKFLDTVPPICVLFPGVEPRESQDDHVDETVLTQLSMALKHPVPESECELSLTPDRAPKKPQIQSSLERMSPPNAIDVGIQCDESSVVTMLADPLVSRKCLCCIRSGMSPSGEFLCPAQST